MIRADSYDFGMSAVQDEFDDLEDWVPRSRRPTRRRRGTAFADLHGAYHVINRRVAMELRQHGLAPSEAVVLLALRRYPMATVSIVRQATGLRPSTLDSLLDGLVDREVLERASPRGTPSPAADGTISTRDAFPLYNSGEPSAESVARTIPSSSPVRCA